MNVNFCEFLLEFSFPTVQSGALGTESVSSVDPHLFALIII